MTVLVIAAEPPPPVPTVTAELVFVHAVPDFDPMHVIVQSALARTT